MKERASLTTHLQALDREILELRTEYRGCDSGEERRLIRSELRDRESQRAQSEEQAETLARLPDLWRSMYGEGVGLLAFFTGLRVDCWLTRTRSLYFPYPGGLADAAAWVRRVSPTPAEVYLCGHLLTTRRRRKATAAPLTSLYVDLDHADLKSAAVPEPSVVIESSPGRLQCYWALAEPVAPAVGEALNRRLAAALSADPSGWDLTQLLRVPGTRNHKYPEAPLVRLTGLTGRVYDAEDLARVLPAIPAPAPPSPIERAQPSLATDRGNDDPFVVPFTGRALSIWGGHDVKRTPDGRVDRSASLVRIARLLSRAGRSTEAIIAALAERDARLGWRKYSDRDDAARQYERIADLVQREVAEPGVQRPDRRSTQTPGGRQRG